MPHALCLPLVQAIGNDVDVTRAALDDVDALKNQARDGFLATATPEAFAADFAAGKL